ncbi:hypothetical protein NDU88_000129 [Pleurodeles waltl]|uniref:Uncharacterized protein n=1 Tax=Pleurodeles waltl TaxID=8319 RepID=A0AAV7L7N1_PLEWA|nr:hypothetical protein NDU88_000129 [Pleurodeles waltl]
MPGPEIKEIKHIRSVHGEPGPRLLTQSAWLVITCRSLVTHVSPLEGALHSTRADLALELLDMVAMFQKAEPPESEASLAANLKPAVPLQIVGLPPARRPTCPPGSHINQPQYASLCHDATSAQGLHAVGPELGSAA